MSLLKVAVFPNTNLFLHYRALNEIDWCSILGAGAVEIKIAAVVTHELEEQKTLHRSRKIRDRAAAGLRLLHKYLGQRQVRVGVTLEFLIKEPTVEYASSRGLNLQIKDDQLIGALLLYRGENPDVPCVLVTSDLPLTVKATHYEINLVPPNETLLLPPEPDEAEKKIRQLEAELVKYKLREPVLDIRFDRGESHTRFQIARPTDAVSGSEAEMQSMLEAAKRKCPMVDLQPDHEPGAPSIENNPFAPIAEAIQGFQAFGRRFYEDYNNRVKAYHRDYERYLRNTFAFKSLATRTIELNMVLANNGTCPAEDIHVLLHFPNGFALYDDEHPPKQPEEPTVPSQELNLFPNVSLLSSLHDIPRLPQLRDPSLPRIR
jgi:PIN domain